VGFNMSWMFIDQIDLNELYAALDVKSTGEAADPYDLGTGRVPLAGLRPKDGWCAIFGHYSFVLDITIGTDPPRLARLPTKSRAVSCVVLEHANICQSLAGPRDLAGPPSAKQRAARTLGFLG